MKKLFLFIALISIGTRAQTDLKFNKRNYQSIDKWVTYEKEKDSSYSLYFIYVDSIGGLTMSSEGSFTINDDGKFSKIDNDYLKNGRIIARTPPSTKPLAEIPASRFKELGIPAKPEWLKIYNGDENSADFLYHRGFLNNEWNEFETALTFLLRAEKIEPTYKQLQTEIGFTYNALGKFDKAVFALLKAIRQDPDDCYAKKELAFAYIHLNKFDKATQTYNAMVINCNTPSFLLETAYNLAVTFSSKKDRVNFSKWKAEAEKHAGSNPVYLKRLDALDKDFGKDIN